MTVTNVLIWLLDLTSSPSWTATLSVSILSPGVCGLYFNPVIGTTSAPSGTFTLVLATGSGRSSTNSSTSRVWLANPRAVRLPLISVEFFTNMTLLATMSRRLMSREPEPECSVPRPTVTTGMLWFFIWRAATRGLTPVFEAKSERMIIRASFRPVPSWRFWASRIAGPSAVEWPLGSALALRSSALGSSSVASNR